MISQIKGLYIIILFFILSSQLQAQGYYAAENSEYKKASRVLLGGSLGAQFGSITLIDVNPRIGYLITDKWIGGVNLKYSYYKDSYYKPTYDTHIFGGSIYSQYFVYSDFYLQAEYGLLAYDKLIQIFPNKKDQVIVPQLLLGGGYLQRVGDHTGFYISLLFDVIESEDTPYSNPIINVGFQVGI